MRLLIALAFGLASCTTINQPIGKNLATICSTTETAHLAFLTAAAFGKVSEATQRKEAAAWRSLRPLCANPDATNADAIAAALTAALVITTALIPGRPAPRLISDAQLASMRPGSVIVDLAAERGGNCELTEPDQVVVRHGVTIIGYTDLAGQAPVNIRSSSVGGAGALMIAVGSPGYAGSVSILTAQGSTFSSGSE